MKLSNMFKKTSRRGYISLGEGKPAHMAPEVPEGLLKKCNVCKSAILTEDVKNGYYICLFRRRQNAGGDPLSDADGKDFSGTEKTP